MRIYPAIDIKQGRAVRLYKGDMEQSTDYGAPADCAARWKEKGAGYLHVVDLDGAFSGKGENLAAVREICGLGLPVQLGGGTDIAKAMAYCHSLITQPRRTMVVLVSDLCEGGSRQNLYRTCHDIVESGARLIALTALNERASPDYDRTTAQTLADLGAHVGAMTPERLADFMAGMMRT